MATWFKGEIDHVGDRLEKAIEKAADEIGIQRSLTKSDVEHLIDYAAEKFGAALDVRIDKARQDTSELITQKISQFREQLSQAATEQKRVAVRNASVAVVASILVGFVSLYYKKYFHGDLELMDIFRSILLALASGYMAWIISRYVLSFLFSPRFKRNAIVVSLRYFGVFRPKGALGHILIFVLVFAAWALLSYGERFIGLHIK